MFPERGPDRFRGKAGIAVNICTRGTVGTEEFLHMISVKQPEGKPFCFNESMDEELRRADCRAVPEIPGMIF